MTDGPLDLTVPLSIAEIRAALSITRAHLKVVGSAATADAPRSASVASARPHNGHRRQHAGPRRLGRIAEFVAVTATLSVGTACALVLSSNAQNTSVSLPAAGAIPVAPSPKHSQPGLITVDTGSTSAMATPSLSHSTAPVAPVDAESPTPTATTTSTASGTPTGTASTTSSAGASASGGAGDPPGSASPPDTPTTSANWVLLYQGVDQKSQAQQETTDVQSLLQNLGYLEPWHRASYIDPYYSVSPDPNGYFGTATSDAVAQFQHDYGVAYTNQLGACDLATYQALNQAVG